MPDAVRLILETLNTCGYDAWAVGGCVRDTLMGATPDDWDIATAATPDEVREAFPGAHIVLTGEKHGTVTLVSDGRAYEITTFRVDGEYIDHRHPQSVSFSRRIEDDLSRRDFTVNAMAMHPKKGLLDPFGGRADIERAILRAVGAPQTRFDEDALRILRAARFQARLGFAIEKETARAMREKAELLRAISVERVWQEFVKALVAEHAARSFAENEDVWMAAIPEADIDSNALGRAPRDLITRLALTLPATACMRLHADRATVRDVDIVRAHASVPVATEYDSKELVSAIGYENATRVLDVKAARGEDMREARETCARLRANNACVSVSMLHIRGADLVALGVRPGPEIGAMLKLLLAHVMRGELPNERESLCAFVRSTVALPKS